MLQAQQRASVASHKACQAQLPGANCLQSACRHRQRLHCRAAAATASADVITPVRSWLISKGADLSGVGVADSLDGSQTAMLVASRDFQAGEALCVIPDSTWFSTASLRSSRVGSAVQNQEPWIQVVLMLISERATGGSAWQPYLSGMSATPGSPLLWSQSELELLEGTQLLELVTSYKQFFLSKFSELQETLFAAQPALFPPQLFTSEAFMWAAATVRGRTRPPLEGADIALVPLADAARHSRVGNSRYALRTAGFLGRGRSLAVEATRNVRKGEEITSDYGAEKLDGQLLLDHGVIDSARPRPGYSLVLTLPTTDRYYDDKLDILEQNGMQSSMPFTLKPETEPPEEMLAFLRLMQMSGTDSFLLESLFRNDVWGHLLLPISEGNEGGVCAGVIEGAAAALAAYPTSIEQDVSRLRSGGIAKGSREELALLVSLGEKQALDSVLRFFEDRAANPKRLVYYQERRLRRLGLIDDDGRTTYDSFFSGGIA